MASKRKKNFPTSGKASGGTRKPRPDAEPAATPLAVAEPSGLAKGFAWTGFVVVLLAVCAWVMAHTVMVDTVTVRLCEIADQGIPPQERMPVFLSEIAMDGYVWNHHAERLGTDGGWRLRHTNFDNAPTGREVHWNSAFAWYLRGLGEIYRSVTGDTLRNSIFRMSIWANPILLCAALAIFCPLAARRFGPLAGSILAIGMVAVPTFYEGFMPAYPDHHGIIAFSILGMIFGIAWAGAGWVSHRESGDFATAHTLKQARHGMIISGVFGAMGLWISALSMAIVLGSVGVSALLVMTLFGRDRKGRDASVLHPEIWKTWAIAGAATAFGLYLLEYFPSHLSPRLEVNNPLYAIAWLGGGWILAEYGRWISSAPSPFPWRKFVLPLGASLLLPATILLTGSQFYMPFDPFMKRLHENIAEFLPLITRIVHTGLPWQVAFGFFPVFILTALALLAFPGVGRGTRAALVFLTLPILLITGLQFYQIRWGMLNGPLYIALATLVIPQLWHLVPKRAVPRGIAFVLLLGTGWLFVAPSFVNIFTGTWSQFKNKDSINVTFGQGLALLHRQMALAIKRDAGDQPVVVLSSPNSSCLLAGLGGFKTVGTLYWENRDGLFWAAQALNAQSDEEIAKFLKERGITHVSLMTWENFIEPYFRLLHPEPTADATLDKSFGINALFRKTIPATLRPLPFVPSDSVKPLQQEIIMARFAPDQSLLEASFHVARYAWLVQNNTVAAEIAFKEILDAAPESGVVRINLVEMYLGQKRYEEAFNQAVLAMEGTDPAWRDGFAREVAAQFNAAGQSEFASKILEEAGKSPAK